MTPDNSKLEPPSVDEPEAGALDREIDMYCDWDFYTAAEDRSLDRMIEAHRRDREERASALKPAPKSPRKPRRRSQST